MQTDPVMEWRRLTEYYRSLSDDALRELALDFGDLTEAAQQVMRGELKSRGLGDPETIAQAPAVEVFGCGAARQPEQTASTADADAESDADSEDKSDGPHEYTWKTLLCECETHRQAWQIAEALRRARIESWIDGPSRYSPHSDLDVTNPRVLVAADQLDQARAILAQPIPQDIIDESEEETPAYVVPNCPGCGAVDPVLESADPVNAWHCEVCGREWTDAPATQAQEREPAPPSAEQLERLFGIRKAGDGKSRPATGQLYPQGE
jgi:hypothetical protein